MSDFNKYLELARTKDLVFEVLRGDGKVIIIKDSALTSETNQLVLQNGIHFFPSQRRSVLISKVLVNSIASTSGLMDGDLVISVSGLDVYSIKDFVSVIKKNTNRSLELLISRFGETLTINITPQASTKSDLNDGFIGVELSSQLYSQKNKYLKYSKKQ